MLADFANIPQEMKQYPNWIVWRLETRGDAKPGDKPTKVLYNPNTPQYRASTTKPPTWSSYDMALQVFNSSQTISEPFNGLGFVFTNTPYVAVDIDHCHDNGQFTDDAAYAISLLNSYTELSQSGTGLHIICRGKLPKGKRRRGGFEMYGDGSPRYFAMTGDVLDGKPPPIRECQDEIDEIHAKYIADKPDPKITNAGTTDSSKADDLLDFEILAKARKAKNGTDFTALYDHADITGYASPSEADLALCNMLAFWTCRDAQRMDALFRQSGLMRTKWDELHGAKTYGAATVEKAIYDCKSIYDPPSHYLQQMRTRDEAAGKSLEDFHPDTNDRYGWHDMGNGYLFADWYMDVARYVKERTKWFTYDGKVWKPDIGGLRVSELCKSLADDLMFYALSIPDELRRSKYIGFVRNWQRRSYRDTVIKEATSVYPVSIAEFDTGPYMLNCQNGTLNLQTREFHSHTSADMLSMISGVSYDPRARCDRWERFIHEVMQGDTDKAVYLQKSLGYALTGDTRHECFFILYGASSRNGKGTTMESFSTMLGDYAKAAKPESIAQKQNSNGGAPSEDIARLAGARFVNISEPDKRLVLSTALVKTLTGNDTIAARFLHENSFEYQPQFKLFINTNHLPQVTDITLFSSGRVKIIPFERHFSEDEQDRSLKAELTKPEALSGILNWCIDGLWLIQETGFNESESVRAATDEYRRLSDKIGRFLNDEFEADPFAETQMTIAYTRYQDWCRKNGHFPENNANFKASLSNISTVKTKRPAGSDRRSAAISMLMGYRIKPNLHQYGASNF